MQNLLFFSRVAFICNICFGLTWLLRFYPSLQSGHVVNTVLILGLVVAMLLNAIVNIALLVLLLRRKPLLRHFPGWLIIVNFLFLLPQLIMFLR